MDQTDFSLLVGFVIGFPIANTALRLVFPELLWWEAVLAAFPLGLLPVAAATYALVGYIGSKQARRKADSKDVDPGREAGG